MIFLETENGIVKVALQTRFEADKKERLKTPLDVKCGDFDGTKFHITGSGLSKNDFDNTQEIIKTSIFLNGAKQLFDCGLVDFLKKVFGDLVQIDEKPEDEYSITLSFNLDATKEDDKKKLLQEIPLLKRHCMMPPFVKSFNHSLKNEKFDCITFQYRPEETIYINMIEGSINVTFSVKFDDPDDITIAKVLLTEFKDARRDKALGNAPSVTFYEGVKPLELKDVKSVEGDTKESLKEYGFICLSLRQSHCSEKDRVNTINLLLQFRNYLHYHLKCAKAYMHMRMRERVVLLLQALDDARDKTGIEVKKKTFSGKTFESKFN